MGAVLKDWKIQCSSQNADGSLSTSVAVTRVTSICVVLLLDPITRRSTSSLFKALSTFNVGKTFGF